MAYKTLPPPGYPGSQMHTFYNLTSAVGPRKRNQPDDVMLVQICLQHIYTYGVLPWSSEGDWYPIAPDGKFGPITHNAIWIFQSQMRERAVNIYPDGVVDQANDWRGATSLQYSYTILWLNWGLLQVIGENRFAHLDVDNITPRVLGVRLAISDF